MLGTKTKSAVRIKVEDIAWRNSRAGCINQSVFKDIRNQEVVRTALIDLDYIPDCAAKPTVWRKKGVKPVVVSNRDKIMPTESGRKILQTLLETGVVYVADVPLAPRYLQTIIYDIKNLGHQVESVKKGTSTTAYRLIEQA